MCDEGAADARKLNRRAHRTTGQGSRAVKRRRSGGHPITTRATKALVVVTVVLVVAAIVSAILAGIALSHDKQPIVVRVCQSGTNVAKC